MKSLRTLKRLGAAALCALMIAGCSSQPKEAKTSCSADIDGMQMNFTLTAPDENAEVSAIDFDFKLPYSAIRERAGEQAAGLSDSQVKSHIESQEDTYKSLIASILGIDAENITSKFNDDSMDMSITLNDMEKLRSFFGIDENEDMTYKTLVDDAKKTDGMTCD